MPKHLNLVLKTLTVVHCKIKGSQHSWAGSSLVAVVSGCFEAKVRQPKLSLKFQFRDAQFRLFNERPLFRLVIGSRVWSPPPHPPLLLLLHQQQQLLALLHPMEESPSSISQTPPPSIQVNLQFLSDSISISIWQELQIDLKKQFDFNKNIK